MSWRKQRVYKCDVCGKLQPVSRYNDGAPAFWHHTGNRHGFTICSECWAAVAWARTARERENAAKFKKFDDLMSRGDDDKED